MRIELENGKYTYINDAHGQRANRHGEPWRDLTGDKFIYCFAERVNELEAENAALREQLAAVQAETIEQARFVGMGAEREAALLGKVEMLERELAAAQKDAERGTASAH